jgi:L-2-hydroxyglutarate oxidase LhgO
VEKFDAVVVGAGAVGLAVTRALALKGKSVLSLERHRRHGLETSSRNSEVVHSGLYYPKGSLKAVLCLEGNRKLFEYCAARGVFIKRTGKMVVACSEDEIPKLEELKTRGLSNGVSGLEVEGGGSAATRLKVVNALAVLWIPSTGIVDSEELMQAYLKDAEDAGAVFLWDAELKSAVRKDGGYVLRFGNEDPVWTKAVVNSAGLSADFVAALPGLDVDAANYRLHYFKGEYFTLRKRRDIDTLVYPVPARHGLGIHLTIDRQGAQRLGPNAFPVDALDYEIDASHREEFWRAAKRYLPDLSLDELIPGTAGIRPKLSADGGFRDFVIAEESARGLPGWVNLVGIESPGLTCSLPIADSVCSLLAA